MISQYFSFAVNIIQLINTIYYVSYTLHYYILINFIGQFLDILTFKLITYEKMNNDNMYNTDKIIGKKYVLILLLLYYKTK